MDTTRSTHVDAVEGPTGRRWTTLAAAVALTLLAALLVTTMSSTSSEAQGTIDIVPLTDRHELTDDVAGQIRLKPDGRARDVLNLRDLSNVAVLEITIEPGARFPWHTHPGPVLAAVTTGELVYVYADDCVERPYPAGTAFVDPGGDNVHTAFNPGGEEVVVIATFLGAPPDGPLTLPVDDDREQELQERCRGEG